MTNSPQSCSAGSAEALALADEYEAGMNRALASGYEEFGPLWESQHRLVIKALRSFADAQAVQVRNETIEECARITTAPFGLAYTSQRHKEVAKDVADQIGRAIRALAAQPPAAPVEANQAFETYRETVKNVAAAREKGYAAARENLKEAWSAIAMIREAVETLAPSGSVKAAEHLDGPTFTHEADALVAGIMSLAAHNGCSADCETEIKCTDCGVTGFDEHKPGCRGIRQQQYVPSAELRAATEQQPVYYRYRTKLHGGDWMVVRPDDLPKDKSGWEIEPLYRAVPQPAAVPDLDTAWQWDGKELLHDTPDWVAENTEQTWSSLSLAGFTGGITAFTSFGKARLKKGDWLVRHEGEIHAVKDAVYSALSRPESK